MKKLLLQLLVSLGVLGLNYVSVYSQGFISSENTIDERADIIALADLNRNNTVELIMITRIDASNSRISIYEMLPTLTKLKEINIAGLDNPKLKTVDFNNDGILELAVSGTIEGKPSLDILKGDVAMNYTSLFSSVPQLNSPFKIIDFDQDGRLDLLGSLFSENGDSLRVYLNKGDFLLACQNCLSNIKGSPELLIDIANDGFFDLLVSNETGLHFYGNLGMTDSISYNVLPEFTDDMHVDFGDMNQDGVDELIIAGLIDQAFSFSIMEFDTNRLVTLKNHQVLGQPKDMRIADFTNDGELDILLQEGDSLMLYQMNANDIALRHAISGDLESVSFDIIDLDRDLDLDIIVSGAKQPDYMLQFITNNNILNSPPLNPSLFELFAIPMGDSVQFIWGSGTDDTTPNQSLTYELFVQDGNGKPLLPLYLGMNRSLADYGRQLHTREYVLKGLDSGNYIWAVQSIDNSLVGGSGVCQAQFAVGLSSEIVHDVCSGDTLEISLEPLRNTRWYSLNRGFIQESNTLTYVAQDNDIIYTSYIVDGGISKMYTETVNVYETPELQFENFDGCVGDSIIYSIEEEIESATWKFLQSGVGFISSSVEVLATVDDTLVLSGIGKGGCLFMDTILINVNEGPELHFEDFNGCVGDEISYSLEEEIESATWEFLQSGETVSGSSISITAEESDILVLSAEGNCWSKKDTIMINVSSPDINAGADLKVVYGNSIQLQASGGANYSWSPPNTLSNPNIANPIASPEATTTYTVTGYNDAGCSDTDDVIVNVQQIAFVPNLFSPNGDGNNDELTVYSTNISNGEFKVFDLMGQLVFSTQVSSGNNPSWDGTRNGNPLGQGTYVWSLSGRYIDGSSIAQVGPASGTVTLIR